MSYGVWKKRGKDWASIEIDSPWNYNLYELERYEPQKLERLKKDAERQDLYCDMYASNPHQLRWEIGQSKKDRKVVSWHVGGGEHETWFAYDNIEALKAALIANEVHADERQSILDRAGHQQELCIKYGW